MNWIKRIFKKTDSKPIVSDRFKEWYIEYRSEMAKAFNADYAICIASWTFSENHEKYFIKGLSPKEAVLEYMIDRDSINNKKTIQSIN